MEVGKKEGIIFTCLLVTVLTQLKDRPIKNCLAIQIKPLNNAHYYTTPQSQLRLLCSCFGLFSGSSSLHHEPRLRCSLRKVVLQFGCILFE
jgi:hypothetical protein